MTKEYQVNSDSFLHLDFMDYMVHIESLASKCYITLNSFQKDPTKKWLDSIEDEAKGTGRTTLLILYYLAKAINNPWKQVAVGTHFGEVCFIAGLGSYSRQSGDAMFRAITDFLDRHEKIDFIRNIKDHIAHGFNVETIAFCPPEVPEEGTKKLKLTKNSLGQNIYYSKMPFVPGSCSWNF